MSIHNHNQEMAQEMWQATAGAGMAAASAQVVASGRPGSPLSRQLPFLPDYYSFLPVAYDENEEEKALQR